MMAEQQKLSTRTLAEKEELAQRGLAAEETIRKTSEASAQRTLEKEAKFPATAREWSRQEAQERARLDLQRAIDASKAKADARRQAADRAAQKEQEIAERAEETAAAAGVTSRRQFERILDGMPRFQPGVDPPGEGRPASLRRPLFPSLPA